MGGRPGRSDGPDNVRLEKFIDWVDQGKRLCLGIMVLAKQSIQRDRMVHTRSVESREYYTIFP